MSNITYLTHVSGIDHPYVLYNEALRLAVQVNDSDATVVAVPFTGDSKQTWVSVTGVEGCWFLNEATATYLTATTINGEIEVQGKIGYPMEWNTPASMHGLRAHHVININSIKPISGSDHTLALTLTPPETKLHVAPVKDVDNDEWILRAPVPSPDPNEFVDDGLAHMAKVTNHVRNTVVAMNSIIDVLANPDKGGDEDLIDLAYSKAKINEFKARARECAANLELALRLTSRWAERISKHLSDDTKRLYETQSKYNDKVAEKAGLEAKVSQLQKSLEPLEKQVANSRSELESSRRKYDAARAAYDKAVKNRDDWGNKSMCEKAALAGPGRGNGQGWNRQSQNDDSARRMADDAANVRDRAKSTLDGDEKVRDEVKNAVKVAQDGITTASSKLADISKEMESLESSIKTTEKEVRILSGVSSKLETCVLSIQGASVRPDPSEMSLVVVVENLRGLRKDLQDEKNHDFEEPLTQLDNDRLDALSKRIKALQL